MSKSGHRKWPVDKIFTGSVFVQKTDDSIWRIVIIENLMQYSVIDFGP